MGQFFFSDKLINAISVVISGHEGNQFKFQKLDVTIPEHQESVFSSPLDGYNAWGGGLNALSGAQIAAFNEKYGRMVDIDIPEEDWTYLVCMDAESRKTFSRLPIKSEEYIAGALDSLTTFWIPFDEPLIDSSVLCERFPYLEGFFENLQQWCEKTKRVTFTDDILKDSIQKALPKPKTKRKDLAKPKNNRKKPN